MNIYNKGLAPIVVVLIIVGVAVIGGGIYIATKDSGQVVISSPTTTITASASVLPLGTSTPRISAQPTQSAIKTGTPKPVANVGTTVSFANVQAAVSSGKLTTCMTGWFSEKGPDQSRLRYTISPEKVVIRYETNSGGKISTRETTYLPGDSNYAYILTSSLTSASCTQ